MDNRVLTFLKFLGETIWDGLNNITIPGFGFSALGLLLGICFLGFFFKFINVLFGNIIGSYGGFAKNAIANNYRQAEADYNKSLKKKP